ncbi:LuxR family transcriptional regulator [Streptomyces sp. NPDC004042]|uniref:helix-turn-helix transcriptional regulator n=1 Tax=Streptomyces sp. NPDC004042 TaxID=3154451 RepID=UPI0033B0D832
MDEHADGGRAAVGPETDGGPPLVGREAELPRVLRALDMPSPDPVLLLLGEPGTGKSALLERAVRRAPAAGVRVLRAEGSEPEKGLPFAALHQLLRPSAAEWDGLELAGERREVLRGVLAARPVAADGGVMAAGVAVLDLLSALGGRCPLLVVVDDAQWCDRASLEVLSFVARRLAGEPVTMLVAARPGNALPVLGPRAAALTLGPLDAAAAGRLLDLRPDRPTGRLRARILAQAEGNPLALTELAGSATTDAAGPVGPLPLAAHLERIHAAPLGAMPAAARRALLRLAALEPADSPALAAVLADAGDAAWAAAERAGLVRRTDRGPRFGHPLLRSAVYHAAPFDARREAHRALAGLLDEEPDRRAWHLAAATALPDAAVSAELERTVGPARRRGGHAAAAEALHRAAELAPDRADGARLLVAAAEEAVLTGDLDRVEELAAAVRARTDDPSLLADIAALAGRLAALTVRHTVVFARLADAAEELCLVRPDTALDLLADAVVVRFYCGRDVQRRRIEDVLRRLPEDPSRDWLRTWVRAVCDPFADRAELLGVLPWMAAEARRRPDRLAALGVMAWLLDETPLAVRAFDEAFDRWGSRGPLPDGLGGAATWSYVDQGRWERARQACARSAALAAATGLDHAVSCAAAVDAMVLAHQGDTAAARARAAEALALVDPLESRSVTVYARRALGAADLAEGDFEAAYDRLRTVFTAEGAPVHYHASYPALAELAAAAARSGRRAGAAVVVERCARDLGDDASPRLRALVSRARGLLAGAEDAAEAHFRAALADPVLEHWPFELARTRLDFAEWLRRRRRIAEARAPLGEALETFRRLGARPWAERARAEARAAGLGVMDREPDALARLSPQQQEIVRLAARGLTNREIGEKLFLSPRTVGSHLYRSFPKLGITARSQLRDLVEGAATSPGGRP